MDVTTHLDGIKIVRDGPGILDRLERRIASGQRKAVVGRLRRFREQLASEMAPEPWTTLDGPMVLALADVCAALGLRESERTTVLGRQGEEALDWLLNTHRVVVTIVNERQTRALAHVQEHGAISLGAYRSLCPDWSDETLRRDLANLVQRGLLTKNGARRGTFYTLTAD